MDRFLNEKDLATVNTKGGFIVFGKKIEARLQF